MKRMRITLLSCCIMLLQMITIVGNTIAKNSISAAGHGGQLTVALNNIPTHFNPALHSGVLTGLVGSQIFAGLFRCDENGIATPYLAERWESSGDGLNLLIYLRKNAYFHDGKPIRAADVIFSLETAKRYHPFSTMLAAVGSMDAIDDHTLRLHLKHYHPALLQALTSPLTPILPRHIYGDGQDIQSHPANLKAIGSGPFKLIHYHVDKEITLQAFDRFFLPGRPHLDTIVFKIYPSPDDHPLAIENGEIQLTGFSPLLHHHKQLTTKSNITISQKGFDAIGPMLWLGFNLEKQPFNDIRVRRAFAHAIDRHFIVSKIFGGQSVQMDGPIVPTSVFYSPPEKLIEYDIDRANRLLDEAGYTRDFHGKRMTIDITTPPNASSLTHPLLTYLRHDFSRKIGVDLRIHEVSELSMWSKIISSRNFQLTLDIVFSWFDPVIGVHRTYISDNIRSGVTWSNTLAYSNKEVDTVLAQAGMERDLERRKEYYRKFQNIVRNDQPIVWIGTVPYATISDNRLDGVNNSLWGLLAPMDEIFWRTDETPSH